MNAPQSIKIDNIEYIRKDTLPTPTGDIKIAIVDRGFVYVGHIEVTPDFIIITHAKNIRQWGTTKGLGELVNGPLTNTKLDHVGTVRVATKALIAFIDVEQSAWNSL